MKLMVFDKVIAEQKDREMVACAGVNEYDLPFGVFKGGRCSVWDFNTWAKKRCFPEERMGCSELLKELGLDRYDRWEIIKKTNARMTERDDFWIDFDS